MWPLSLEAKLIAYALAAAALLSGLAWLIHSHDAEVRQKVTDAVAAVGAQQAASTAVTEAQWQAKTQEVIHVAQLQASTASAAAAAAARERDAARVQLNAYIHRRALSSDPAASAGGQTADDGLLAELLDASWQRNLDLAREADARGTAGTACERFADALKETK